MLCHSGLSVVSWPWLLQSRCLVAGPTRHQDTPVPTDVLPPQRSKNRGAAVDNHLGQYAGARSWRHQQYHNTSGRGASTARAHTASRSAQDVEVEGGHPRLQDPQQQRCPEAGSVSIKPALGGGRAGAPQGAGACPARWTAPSVLPCHVARLAMGEGNRNLLWKGLETARVVTPKGAVSESSNDVADGAVVPVRWRLSRTQILKSLEMDNAWCNSWFKAWLTR